MFFIIFLILTTTSCEWVEISQTYHRNEPARFKHNPNTNRVNEANMKYKNETLIPKWSKGTIDRVENVGDIRRVPYASVKTPSVRPYMDIIQTQAPEPYNNRFRSKTPEYESSLKPNAFEDAQTHLKTTRIKEETKFKNTTIFGSDVYKEIYNDNYLKTFTTDGSIFLSDIPTTVKVPQKMSESTNSRINQGFQRIYIEQIKKNPTGNNVDLEITTSYSMPILLPQEEDIVQSNFNSNMKTGQVSINKSQNKLGEKKNPTNLEDNIKVTNGHQPANQENKFEGLWKTIKVVAETISKHSRRTIKGKLKYLEDLKDSILNSIEYHVDRVWPDDDRRRSARSAHEHGHVEIPSSESALMTISFLTFAVFLIKLVLQLIHTYKQKTMMLTPAVVSAVGRAAAAFNRNRNHN